MEVRADVKGVQRILPVRPVEVDREPREIRERKFNYAEGVKEISPGLLAQRKSYPG